MPGGHLPQSLRTPPRDFRAHEDVVDDSVDVPAAVVCAVCGDAACMGCERELSRSGIVSMVAWERPGAPVLGRMWATARAATMAGEGFFELLPDGPIAPALRFAFTVEMIAACGFVASLLPLALVLAPAWAEHVVVDGAARGILLRLAFVGVPSLALLLVAAHAAHGLALDHGARRAGARGSSARALRFGLYASGWDLVLGPVGAVVLAIKEGLGATRTLLGLGVGLPGRCARGFLRGAYQLEGARADRANRSATAVAIVATLLGALAILVGAVLLVLSTG